jgi:sugar phosphate isomerase/epimerase
VHDNNGKDDTHVMPLLGTGGTIDWKNTMQLLRTGQDQYPLILELKDHGDLPHPLDTAMEIYDRLENL